MQFYELIKKHQGLNFKGLHCYHGSLQHITKLEDRKNAIEKAAAIGKGCRDEIKAKYPEQDIFVTGCGTGSMEFDVEQNFWHELQPGSYLFGDVEYGSLEWKEGKYPFHQSLFVLAQVISKSANHVVIDAGNKSHSLDAGVGPKVIFCLFLFVRLIILPIGF